MTFHRVSFAALAAIALLSARIGMAAEPDAAVLQELKALADREEIRALLIEYGRQLDRRPGWQADAAACRTL